MRLMLVVLGAWSLVLQGDRVPSRKPAPPLDARCPARQHLTDPVLGPVEVYRQRCEPARVVLFLSGDGGWTPGTGAFAEVLARDDALVLGLDVRRLLSRLRPEAGAACAYPAADLEGASQRLQHTLKLHDYHIPVLAGYSSGATLAYAALAQAPPGTFAGGISLGFCPDLEGTRQLCTGSGLRGRPAGRDTALVLLPDTVSAPWAVLQGTMDAVCSPAAARAFVDSAGGRLYVLPGVGHGFSVTRNWADSLLAASRYVNARAPSPVPAPGAMGLPLIVVPSIAPGDTAAIMISGDGGWAGIDRSIGEYLAGHGIRVIGLNALRYFWSPRTPAGTAQDVGRLINLARHGGARHVLLIGYSRGADVLPFVVPLLPDSLRAPVIAVALVAPSRHASFEFHLTDLVSSGRGAYDVVRAIGNVHGLPVLCISGDDDSDSACPLVPPTAARRITLPGGHHLGGAYREIAQRILGEVGR